jgi:hypothetical protein
VQPWFNHEQKNNNARRNHYAHNGQNPGQNIAHAPMRSAKSLSALTWINPLPGVRSRLKFETDGTSDPASCPEYVEADRWQQCIIDAQRFLASWGDNALAHGRTADELFGLHEPPEKPHPSYHRLSRYDCTGLIWLLQGRRVVALTADTAALQNPATGNITTYRKVHKPTFGPLGPI